MIDKIDRSKYLDKKEACELLELTYKHYDKQSAIDRIIITIAETYEFRSINIDKKKLYLKEDVINLIEKIKEFYNKHYPSNIANEICPELRYYKFEKVAIPKAYNLILRDATKSEPGTKVAYKKNEIDNFLIARNEILERIEKGELIKKKDAEKFLGISERTFNRYRKELNLEEVVFKQTMYFNKLDLMSIKDTMDKPKSKNRKCTIDNKELKNYIDKDEARQILEITHEHYNEGNMKTVLRNVVIGFNIKYITKSGRNFYLKEDIEKAIVETKVFFEKHYTVEEAKTIRPNLYTLNIERVKVPSHYKAILRSSLNFNYNMINVYRKEDIDKYNENLTDIETNIKNGIYISHKEAYKMLNMTRNIFNKAREEYKIKEINYKTSLYFEKKEISALLKEQEKFYKTYIDKKEMKEKYLNENTYYKYGKNLKEYKAPLIAYTKYKYRSLQTANGNCHKISDLKELVKSLESIKRENQSKAYEEGKGRDYINYNLEGETYFDTFNLRLYDNWDGFSEKSVYTKEKWFKFMSDKIETMNASKKVALGKVNHYIRCTKTLKLMLEYFDIDEVYQLTTNQINTYFNIIETNVIRITLYEFLGIVSADLKIILKSKRKGFRFELINSPHANLNKKEEDEVYGFEVYQEVFNYLIDTDIHIKKSIHEIKTENTVKYVSTWLYAMLHLNNAWRHGDVTRFPRLKIEDLLELYEINSLEWFLNNEITIDKARAIISRIIQWEIIISKTQVTGSFFCSDELAPALATSIAILSLYHLDKPVSRYDDSIMVLGSKYNDVYQSHLNNLFENLNNSEFKFSSKKMNKTVMTYIYYLANLSGDSKSLLYAKKIREHMSKESTLHYINIDFKHIESLSKQLFMRGEFGYISNLLLSRVHGEQITTLENTTEQIMRLNYIFGDVFKMHSAVGFLNTIRNERELVVATLAEKSLKECQEILTDLFAKKMPSRELNVQCLMSKEGCQRPNLRTCFECQYHIPSIYALTTLCKSLMVDINQYHTSSKIKQYKLSLAIERKLVLLKEAIETFGYDYVYSCLNIEEGQLEILLDDIKTPIEYIDEF